MGHILTSIDILYSLMSLNFLELHVIACYITGYTNYHGSISWNYTIRQSPKATRLDQRVLIIML